MTPNLDFKVTIFLASNNSKMMQDRANRDSEPTSGLTACVNIATGQVL